ncbi:MAG: hypothetical protein A2219_08485 [Elusimicrobia bacterium RIFOXYA2_FULL_50_26]|nr:MAG: hypothetical protein A2219_08485 [Elusimicrobia bacterium RIFOXYA2_FULL_50_26]
MGAKRWHHVMAVRKAAMELARLHKVPPLKAEQAALLHDAARFLSDAELVRYTRKHRLKVPLLNMVIRHNAVLLHGYVAADIARKKFGVTARDVLSAIQHHTLAHEGMSKLSKIIYLADSVSADRRYAGVSALRSLSRHNLDEALLEAMASKMTHVLRKRGWLHPQTIKAWNKLAGYY